MSKEDQNNGMGYLPSAGLENLAYEFATQPPPNNQPPTVNIGGHNILDVSDGAWQAKNAEPMQRLAASYVRQQQISKGRAFLKSVHDVMASNMAHEDRISHLMALKSQHGTDYGLGLDEMTKQIGELAKTGREQRLQQQNMYSRATTLRKELNTDQIRKNYNILNQSVNGIRQAYKLATDPNIKTRAAADQAIGVLFQKMLDPDSVVREGEFARTEAGQAILTRVQATVDQFQKGGLRLDDNTRLELLRMAEMLLENGGKTYNSQLDRYNQLSLDYQIDPDLVVGGLDRFEPKGENGGSSGAVAPKQLDRNTAAQILKEAGGDKAKARQIASQKGYTF